MKKSVFSGDWLVTGGPGGGTGKDLAWDLAFEGVRTGGWSGGVNFKVTRAVAEAIAELMNAEADKAGFDAQPTYVKVTDTQLIAFETCDREFYINEFDADGLVEVPSWAWYELDAEDLPRVKRLVV